MSKRRKSRTKRPQQSPAEPKPRANPEPRAKRVAAPAARPPAPWGKAPLAELVIFAGIVALVYGFVAGAETAIVLGVVLASLGGLEVAIREHFAGYRSHSTLLAAFPALVVAIALFYFGQGVAVCVVAGAVIFAAGFYLARRAFQRASGGLSFRVGGMRG